MISFLVVSLALLGTPFVGNDITFSLLCGSGVGGRDGFSDFNEIDDLREDGDDSSATATLSRVASTFLIDSTFPHSGWKRIFEFNNHELQHRRQVTTKEVRAP